MGGGKHNGGDEIVNSQVSFEIVEQETRLPTQHSSRKRDAASSLSYVFQCDHD